MLPVEGVPFSLFLLVPAIPSSVAAPLVFICMWPFLSPGALLHRHCRRVEGPVLLPCDRLLSAKALGPNKVPF